MPLFRKEQILDGSSQRVASRRGEEVLENLQKSGQKIDQASLTDYLLINLIDVADNPEVHTNILEILGDHFSFQSLTPLQRDLMIKLLEKDEKEIILGLASIFSGPEPVEVEISELNNHQSEVVLLLLSCLESIDHDQAYQASQGLKFRCKKKRRGLKGKQRAVFDLLDKSKLFKRKNHHIYSDPSEQKLLETRKARKRKLLEDLRYMQSDEEPEDDASSPELVLEDWLLFSG